MTMPEANKKYLSKHKAIWIENKWYRLLKEEAAKEQRTTKKQLDFILAERYGSSCTLGTPMVHV